MAKIHEAKQETKKSFFVELLDSQKEYPCGYLIPLIAILAFIPLIVHLYTYNPGLNKYNWIQATSYAMDFFLHSKMIWLYIAYIAILFVLVYMIFSEEMKPLWDKIFIPIFVYAGICLISAIFSVDTKFSFSGIFEQFESVWMLLGYVLLLYYASFTISSEKAFRCLIPWFNTGVALMTALGLAQAFNMDPYYLEPLQKLFISDPDWIGRIQSAFEPGRTYLSLYNPNYVGYYVVMIVPILLILLLHTKRIVSKLIYLFLMAAQLFILFASQSRAGILILGLTFFIMLLCMRNYFIKNPLPVLIVGALTVIAFIGINALNDNVLINRMKTMFEIATTNQDLESIVTGKKDVTITYKGNEIHFSYTVENTSSSETEQQKKLVISVKDQDGNDVAFTPSEDGTQNVITDPRFPFSFGQSDGKDYTALQVTTPKVVGTGAEESTTTKTWRFTNDAVENDSSYYVVGPDKEIFFKLKKHEEGIEFLETHSSLANKRGYIWSKTITILKKYFFLGSGPDTFIIVFPNDDLVGLMNSGHDDEIISKPHCLYLQIAVQTGIPSLIAFLIFFFWYIGSSFRLYKKQDFSKLLPKAGVGILSSVIGFLLLGLTNDSCIAVTPIFYALAGVGLGINFSLKKEQTE